jgi:hypothetical protein
MRRARLIGPLLAAFALAACGDDDAAKAEQTVSSAVTAVAEGHAAEACSKMTPAAQHSVVVALRHNPIGADIRAATCEQALTKFHAQLSKPIRDSLVDGDVDDAKLHGDTATVYVVDAALNVRLAKRNGRWLITGGFLD